MLGIEDVLALESGVLTEASPPPPKSVLDQTLENIQKNLGTPSANENVYMVQAAEGRFLNLTEKTLNDLIQGNRAYKKILAAATKTTATEPVPVPDIKRWNTKILNTTPYIEPSDVFVKDADATAGHQSTDYTGTFLFKILIRLNIN